MATNHDLVQAFAKGKTTGQSNRMEIKEDGDGNTYIEGYGWAKYAERDAETGEITVYTGWADWARERGGMATIQHIGLIEPKADVVSDDNPKTGRPDSDLPPVGRTPVRTR